MRISLTIMAFAIVCVSWAVTRAADSKFERCVPETADLTNAIVSSGASTSKRLTVKERLVQLKARCKKDKLVDGRGREIRIYTLVGCWGNPPENYEEILRVQQEELTQLKKKFTVIEIPCSQSDPRLIQ